MATVLAYDLSFHFGWSFDGPGGCKPVFGTKHLPAMTGNKVDGFEIGHSLNALFDIVWEQIDVFQPGTIALEAPLPPQAQRFQQKSDGLARAQLSMAGIVEMIAFRRRIPCVEAKIEEVKKFWTEHGRASKWDMIRVCRLFGWDVKDDNQADSAALWALIKCDCDAEFREYFKHQLSPLFRRAA